MAAARPPRIDLAHVDGLRGILAAFVVLAHTARFTGETGALEQAVPVAWRLLNAGDVRVPAFVAISGFTLMIAVAQRGDARLGGTYRSFAARRIRRLVPPYLAALALALALIAFVPVMNTPHGTIWDDKLPVSLQSVVAHVFLFHNFSPEWISTINGTLWSLPVELQLMLLMPLFLVLWRRTHPVVVIGVAFAVAAVSIRTGIGVWSAPQFLGVFAIGMYGAWLTIGTEEQLFSRRPRVLRRVLQWHRTVLVSSGGLLLGTWLLVVLAPGTVNGVVLSVVVGLGMTLLLMVLADGQRTGRPGTQRVRVLLAHRRLVEFGLVSYSVFLVHSPLLALGNLLLLPLALPAPVQFALMLVVVAPVAVLVCVVFAVLVERPFMNSHQRTLVRQLFSRAQASHRAAPEPSYQRRTAARGGNNSSVPAPTTTSAMPANTVNTASAVPGASSTTTPASTDTTPLTSVGTRDEPGCPTKPPTSDATPSTTKPMPASTA